MTTKFFFENYNLDDMEINNIYCLNKKLILDVSIPIYLELIANGYRPEMDVTQHIEFSFDVDDELEFTKPYNISMRFVDCLEFTISNKNIIIRNSEVKSKIIGG